MDRFSLKLDQIEETNFFATLDTKHAKEGQVCMSTILKEYRRIGKHLEKCYSILHVRD